MLLLWCSLGLCCSILDFAVFIWGCSVSGVHLVFIWAVVLGVFYFLEFVVLVVFILRCSYGAVVHDVALVLSWHYNNTCHYLTMTCPCSCHTCTMALHLDVTIPWSCLNLNMELSWNCNNNKSWLLSCWWLYCISSSSVQCGDVVWCG